METLKRLSCKWKGQTVAYERSTGGAGSPISRMPQQQKAGYDQHTSPIQPNTTPILNVLIQMKNDNKADSTINFTRKALTYLSKHTSLSEPEAVKQLIAQTNLKNGYKRNLCIAYNKYCKHYKIEWNMPKYKPEEREIIPPRTTQVMMLIAEASKRLSLKLQLSMETGLRPIELQRLTPKDIHIEEKLVTPLTAKNGNPRTLKISAQLTTRIQEHIIKNNLKTTDKLFIGTADKYGDTYRTMRNKLSEKLNDPSIRTIRLYDLRHYFCSHKLEDIKNPYVVMRLMGHKKLTTTQKYMHLLNLDPQEWIVEGTTDKERAKQLLTANFTYQLTTPDGTMLFRKPK